VRYGGNTSCCSVHTDAGTLLVLDCGTGGRLLGEALVEESRTTGAPPSGALLIGHTHWDHIHGLPFFAPLFVEGARWDIYGPRGLVRTLDSVLAGQMEYQYFPVALDEVAAEVRFHDLVEGVFEVGDASIRTQFLNHPALTVGYRIDADGATVVYSSDHEPFEAELAAGGDLSVSADDARHVAFLAGADVVVHDAQYLAAEYEAKLGWGHSTMEYAVDAALAGDVAHLVLYHHDPSRTDDQVDAVVADARERVRSAGGTMVVSAATEGEELVVTPRAGAVHAASADPSATDEPAVEDLPTYVVVETDDAAFASAVRRAAEAEGLSVRLDPTGVAAIDGRGVIVVDVDGDSTTSFETGPDRLALLAMTRRGVPPLISESVSDWVVWPCSVAQLRTKLRAAMLRRASRWLAAPLPADEEKRLRTLRSLQVLDTEPEDRFDRYAELARQATSTPIALVTLVDEDRQWFKSRLGSDVVESHRDESFCAHAILGDDVFQVPDVLEDPRFADNPAVTGPMRVRFYAGVPLVLADGSRVGTLCVADHRPRILDDDQLAELRRLAALVVAELERE
jgi:phosphoribosyl 1,2-cyclic phosphodiesterase